MSKIPVHHIHHKSRFTYKLLTATTLLILFVLFLFSFSPIKKFTYNLQPTTHNYSRVPEPNDRSFDKNIAVPQAAYVPATGATSKTRIFSVNAEDSSLSEEKIIVYEGDIVRIQFSASDDDWYDFIIPNLGIRQEARRGETKIVEFQTTSTGSFDFTCSKCKTKGTLVVVPKA